MISKTHELSSLRNLLLASVDSDLAQDNYISRLDQGVPDVLKSLEGKIAPQLYASLSQQIMLFQALPITERAKIISHPYFVYWWHKLTVHYRHKNRVGVETWVPHFSRFLVVPCLRECVEPLSLILRLQNGELRLPDHPYHIVLDGENVPNEVMMTCQEGKLILFFDDSSYRAEIPLTAFWGQHDVLHPLLRERVFLPNTAIELDSSDPWTQLFIDSFNSRPSPEEYCPKDLTLIDPIPRVVKESFIRAYQLLQNVWPEIVSEMQFYTRLIVPFRSQCYTSFSDDVFMGAILVSEVEQPFTNIMYTAELIVHEHSHLRLSVIMRFLDPIFQEMPGGVFYSPFRRDKRPIRGVLHGAFVFARIAHFLRRVGSVEPDFPWRERLEEVVVKIVEALEVLRDAAIYTPLGQSLLDGIEEETRILKQ
ncbi:MAG: hypothetical protein KC418_08430 [Anaerolineales bacterium]|nr:hypothetical protein [Anaerolineales bacterium]MCB8953220.1 hypothetical protein [Ardenticatenales bacterium]